MQASTSLYYTLLHYTILYYTILCMLCYAMLQYASKMLPPLAKQIDTGAYRNRRPMVLYSPLLLLQDIAYMCHFHCSNLFHYDASSQ